MLKYLLKSPCCNLYTIGAKQLNINVSFNNEEDLWLSS